MGKKKPNKINFSMIGWQNNEIRLQTLNSIRNWQKNAEVTKFSDFWAMCVRNRFFKIFPSSRCLGPDSRCFPVVFPLFGPAQKKQNFQKFCPKQWLCGQNAQKKQSDLCPSQVKTDKKNQFFRNLAQNRSKRTKRQNFQKSCFEKVKSHQKTHVSDFVQRTVFAVKTHKQSQIF